MVPFDVLAGSVPGYQVAGRFGVDILGFVRPPRDPADDPGVSLHPLPPEGTDIDAWLGQGAPPPVRRAALQDHVLVVRPRGEFLSTDELALTAIRRDGERWALLLEITRSESENGLPAPRDLYVVLRIDPGDHPLRSLDMRFAGRRRDFQGNESSLPEPMAPGQLIEISD